MSVDRQTFVTELNHIRGEISMARFQLSNAERSARVTARDALAGGVPVGVVAAVLGFAATADGDAPGFLRWLEVDA